MAFQGGKEETSNEFGALSDFAAPVEGTNPQDWIDANDLLDVRGTLPQVVGRIPNAFLETPSEKSSALKNTLFPRICILAAVFGLGFLASTSIHSLTSNRRETLEKNHIAQIETVDVKTPDEESSDEDVLSASLAFDSFDSGNAVPFDDLYGTGFVTEPESTPLADSVGPSFQNDQNDLDYDDSFPTWADLAPRDSNAETQERPAGSRDGAFVTEGTSERSFDKQSANAIPNDGITDARPVSEPIGNPSAYEAANADDSFLTQSQPYAPGFAPQSDRRFQPFGSVSDNNNGYANNNNYPNDSGLNSNANGARYVDDSRNANYNSRERDNGYAANAEYQNAYAQIAPSSAQLETESAEERETPAYVSSIPTFNNPRPGESRREYVAQTYEETSPQKPASKPTRALRW